MLIYGEEVDASVVTLPRYAQFIGYSECAFFGISSYTNTNYECREIWSLSQREDISMYLYEAQKDIEQILNFPIGRQWFANERHLFKPKILTKYGKIISSGIRASTDISLGVATDLTVDPCHIHINPCAQPSDLTEVHVFHPGTDHEIVFSNISWNVATGLLIEIPKCRLISTAYQDNPTEGWVYTDNSKFEATVDVKRIYNDDTTQASLVYRNPLTDFDQELYKSTGQYISGPEIGEITLELKSNECCNDYEYLLVNYYAGLFPVTRAAENAIIRLAHSKMATEPCGCDVTQRMWKRDRHVPDVLTRERLNCPFGLSEGAWYSWKWACNNELVRISPLIGRRDYS